MPPRMAATSLHELVGTHTSLSSENLVKFVERVTSDCPRLLLEGSGNHQEHERGR